MLLHAGGERRQVWTPIAETLTQAGYTSIAYDLRGHGESGDHRADDLPSFAADIARIIETTDAAPILVGASLGGLAAILALKDRAIRHRVAGLVLVDVVPDPPADRTDAFLERTVGTIAHSGLVEDILDRTTELRTIAEGLRLPVLLVRGGENSALIDADVERFMELVPHAKLARINQSGHLIAHEAPFELAAQLIAHLRDPRVRLRRIGRFLDDTNAAETAHPGGTLLAHLHRTGDTLEQWAAPAWVVDAARVHAAYGTDGFPHPMAGASPQLLTAVVGTRSEQFVARYCYCSRRHSYPTFLTDAPVLVDRRTGEKTPLDDLELRAFLELTMANEIDVVAHRPEFGADTAALFRRWLPFVGESARTAVNAWVGKHLALPRPRGDGPTAIH